MTPDELYARLLLVPDSTQEIIRLIGTIDYDRAVDEYRSDTTQDATRTAAWGAPRIAARDAARAAARDAARDATQTAVRTAAWDAARGAAWDAAWRVVWDVAQDAAWDTAYDATLLAGVMVVHDILEKVHRDVALSHFCWWLRFKKEK